MHPSQVSVVLLLSCSAVVGGSAHAQGAQPRAVHERVRRIEAEWSGRGGLWPGFRPAAFALAIYSADSTYLFGHPAPPPPFKARAAGDVVMPGRHPAVTANTSVTLGGTATATLLLDARWSVVDAASIATHELFHVWQRQHHPHWIGNEVDLFLYPAERVDALVLLRRESGLLLSAAEAPSDSIARCVARAALAVRTERYRMLVPALAAYERGTELNEGLASWVEARAGGRARLERLAGRIGPGDLRQRAYASGLALATLLERLVPQWRDRLASDSSSTLDQLLTTSLGDGLRCTAPRDAHEVARARRDVRRYVADVAAKVERVERAPGHRLVLDVRGGEPLWPQGFDPLNVTRATEGRLLHTRFLRVGNGTGQLEVLDGPALTVGAGEHPLFNGVRRVIVPLPHGASVTARGDTVQIAGAGVTGRFAPARLERRGQAWIVRQ